MTVLNLSKDNFTFCFFRKFSPYQQYEKPSLTVKEYLSVSQTVSMIGLKKIEINLIKNVIIRCFRHIKRSTFLLWLNPRLIEE